MREKEITFEEKDYAAHIREVYETGASYVPDFLTPQALVYLQNLVGELEPFIVQARNNTSTFYVADWDIADVSLKFRMGSATTALTDLIKAEGREFKSLSDWYVTDPFVLRYYDDTLVMPHRDHEEYQQIGVTVSIAGLADFHTHNEEDGKPVNTWRVKPGDAVFLRMSGFNPNVPYDREIFHSVGAPLTSEPRTSIAFRKYIEPPKPTQKK
ncbi:MAG TPA: 2OG-Fe(II) oxygenase family protein [Patescibacteria group bacterium]|nr:2OG-Fe(II) oxygenase family protein [Patescibacteria group bacterium]